MTNDTGRPSEEESDMHPLVKDAVMVVHGAEIFDMGDAARLFSLLRPRRLIVAGIMARVAAVESGLPCEYADRPPSVVIRDLDQPCFLANRGKTPESGRIFGEIVARRVGPAGVIHVECASGEVICWNRDPDGLSRGIANLMGYTLVARASEQEGTAAGTRVIRGCLPGEAVFVNGTVIGVATATEVVIRAGREGVEPIVGLAAKDHGLEKLRKAGPIDPAAAWCKSGAIRSQEPKKRERHLRRAALSSLTTVDTVSFAISLPGEFAGSSALVMTRPRFAGTSAHTSGSRSSGSWTVTQTGSCLQDMPPARSSRWQPRFRTTSSGGASQGSSPRARWIGRIASACCWPASVTGQGSVHLPSREGCSHSPPGFPWEDCFLYLSLMLSRVSISEIALSSLTLTKRGNLRANPLL